MVGCEIKNELQSQGRTQTWLSRQTGIPISTISLMLNGKRKIPIPALELFCGSLDIDPNTVIKPRKYKNTG